MPRSFSPPSNKGFLLGIRVGFSAIIKFFYE
jgi:hypothetical protein